MSGVTGKNPGKFYIHNCTHMLGDKNRPGGRVTHYAPDGLNISVRPDYGSPGNKPTDLKPGEKLEYTPQKDFVKFWAGVMQTGPDRRFTPTEWNSSFGMRTAVVNYYIVQSATKYGLEATVKRPLGYR